MKLLDKKVFQFLQVYPFRGNKCCQNSKVSQLSNFLTESLKKLKEDAKRRQMFDNNSIEKYALLYAFSIIILEIINF